MAIVQVQELIESGVHFGHRASRWNPKMRPFIYGKRNLIHIIDLRETVRGLLRAYRYLAKVASRNSLAEAYLAAGRTALHDDCDRRRWESDQSARASDQTSSRGRPVC